MAMTQSGRRAALGVVAALLVLAGGVALLRGGGGEPPAPAPVAPPVATATPAPEARTAVAPAPTRPARDDGRVVTLMPEETPDPDLPYPEAIEPFIWEETLDRMLGEAGGDVMAVYRKLVPEHRQNLIDLLTVRGELRPWADDILGAEPDSEIREYLVYRVDPAGLDNLEEGFHGDPGLVDLLETATPTPIEAAEWNARLALAPFGSEDYALRLARESGGLFGDDARVSVAANSMILNLSAGRDDVTEEERRGAAQALATWLGPGGGGRELPVAEQVGGFTALAHGAEGDLARTVIEEALAQEDDPQLRQALENLLRTLP